MVNLTKTAAEKLNEKIKTYPNPENVMLRISFGGHG
ncbi:MAG: hypothetical protein H6Q58_707 [Firmicutes bacterium]|nr:hypothetical protein [Bacillota bacterium]